MWWGGGGGQHWAEEKGCGKGTEQTWARDGVTVSPGHAGPRTHRARHPGFRTALPSAPPVQAPAGLLPTCLELDEVKSGHQLWPKSQNF